MKAKVYPSITKSSQNPLMFLARKLYAYLIQPFVSLSLFVGNIISRIIQSLRVLSICFLCMVLIIARRVISYLCSAYKKVPRFISGLLVYAAIALLGIKFYAYLPVALVVSFAVLMSYVSISIVIDFTLRTCHMHQRCFGFVNPYNETVKTNTLTFVDKFGQYLRDFALGLPEASRLDALKELLAQGVSLETCTKLPAGEASPTIANYLERAEQQGAWQLVTLLQSERSRSLLFNPFTSFLNYFSQLFFQYPRVFGRVNPYNLQVIDNTKKFNVLTDKYLREGATTCETSPHSEQDRQELLKSLTDCLSEGVDFSRCQPNQLLRIASRYGSWRFVSRLLDEQYFQSAILSPVYHVAVYMSPLHLPKLVRLLNAEKLSDALKNKYDTYCYLVALRMVLDANDELLLSSLFDTAKDHEINFSELNTDTKHISTSTLNLIYSILDVSIKELPILPMSNNDILDFFSESSRIKFSDQQCHTYLPASISSNQKTRVAILDQLVSLLERAPEKLLKLAFQRSNVNLFLVLSYYYPDSVLKSLSESGENGHPLLLDALERNDFRLSFSLLHSLRNSLKPLCTTEREDLSVTLIDDYYQAVCERGDLALVESLQYFNFHPTDDMVDDLIKLSARNGYNDIVFNLLSKHERDLSFDHCAQFIYGGHFKSFSLLMEKKPKTATLSDEQKHNLFLIACKQFNWEFAQDYLNNIDELNFNYFVPTISSNDINTGDDCFVRIFLDNDTHKISESECYLALSRASSLKAYGAYESILKSYSTERNDYVHFGQEKLCTIEIDSRESPKILLTSSALDQINLDVNALIPLFDKLQRFIHAADWARFLRSLSEVDPNSLDQRSQDILDKFTNESDENTFTDVASPFRVIDGLVSSFTGLFTNSSPNVPFPMLPDLDGSGDSDDSLPNNPNF